MPLRLGTPATGPDGPVLVADLALIFGCGMLWLGHLTGLWGLKLLAIGLLPFIPGELVRFPAAVAVVLSLPAPAVKNTIIFSSPEGKIQIDTPCLTGQAFDLLKLKKSGGAAHQIFSCL